jgi:hypothetical protein
VVRQGLEGRIHDDGTLFTPVVRSPLSSLPRDGGDVRGGSFDFWVAASPRQVLCVKFFSSLFWSRFRRATVAVLLDFPTRR